MGHLLATERVRSREEGRPEKRVAGPALRGRRRAEKIQNPNKSQISNFKNLRISKFSGVTDAELEAA